MRKRPPGPPKSPKNTLKAKRGEIGIEDVRLLTEQIRSGAVNAEDVTVILGLKGQANAREPKKWKKSEAEKALQNELEQILDQKLGLRPQDIQFILKLCAEADPKTYRRGQPGKITLENKLQMIQFGRIGFTPGMVARMIGVAPETVKNFMEKNVEFAEKMRAERLKFFYYLVSLLIRSASRGNPIAIEKLWNRLYPEFALDPLLASKLLKVAGGDEDGEGTDPLSGLPAEGPKRDAVISIVEEHYDIKLRRREVRSEKLDRAAGDTETQKVKTQDLKGLGENVTEGKIVPDSEEPGAAGPGKREPDPDPEEENL